MSGWVKETGADGLPIWRGKDTIRNMMQVTARRFRTSLSFRLLGWSKHYGNLHEVEWLGGSWALEGTGEGLEFSSDIGTAWTMQLADIARVETGRTNEFTRTRDYGLLGVKVAGLNQIIIPDHEWQTFLFLADGTRRPIYHANAARDDCAALAASIREYVEQARHAAPAASPSSPSAPVADGFDL